MTRHIVAFGAAKHKFRLSSLRPTVDDLRERIARALIRAMTPNDASGALVVDSHNEAARVASGLADAVLAVLPTYEQVGWTVPEQDDIALMDGEGCDVGTYWSVPVYVKREVHSG